MSKLKEHMTVTKRIFISIGVVSMVAVLAVFAFPAILFGGLVLSNYSLTEKLIVDPDKFIQNKPTVVECESIDKKLYSVAAMDGRTDYIKSECFYKVALATRNEQLCERILERNHWFLHSAYTKARCKSEVAVFIDKFTKDALSPSDVHGIEELALEYGTENSWDFFIRTIGKRSIPYTCSYSVISASGQLIGKHTIPYPLMFESGNVFASQRLSVLARDIAPNNITSMKNKQVIIAMDCDPISQSLSNSDKSLYHVYYEQAVVLEQKVLAP